MGYYQLQRRNKSQRKIKTKQKMSFSNVYGNGKIKANNNLRNPSIWFVWFFVFIWWWFSYQTSKEYVPTILKVWYQKRNIDFMSIIRWLPLQSDKSFNNLSHDALGIIKSIWKFHKLACSLWNLRFGIYTRIRTHSLQPRPTYWFRWYWNDIKNDSAKPMTYQYQRGILGCCNIQDGVLCDNI